MLTERDHIHSLGLLLEKSQFANNYSLCEDWSDQSRQSRSYQQQEL